MDLQERYDELDNIESALSALIDEITNEDYKAQLRETLYQAQNEKDQIEKRLQEQYEREQKAQEREYWASQF